MLARDHAKLRCWAMAARSQGEWHIKINDNHTFSVCTAEGRVVCVVYSEYDAKFISRCGPKVILELLGMVEQLEKEAQKCHKEDTNERTTT